MKAYEFSRPTWAEIDLVALGSNARALHRRAGVPLLAVIKADAYGHGAIFVARALLGEKFVCGLAVASVDEGRQLREAGIEAPILLLSAILPEEAEAAVCARLTPTISSLETARVVSRAAAKIGNDATIHFKIDTGMTRGGASADEAFGLLKEILALPHLRVSGIYTHLACADEDEDAMSGAQLEMFEKTLRECRELLQEYCFVGECSRAEQYSVAPIWVHAANSAAAMRYQNARFDAVRVGLALYGASPFSTRVVEEPELAPVMTLRSRITNVRDIAAGTSVSYGATWRASQPSCIATVPIGYADGYSRRLSNRGEVLLRGQRCPVVGRVTMDQILVDCSRLKPKVQIGETVTLWGENLPIEEVARCAETIPYELMCAVSRRVPRVYKSVSGE